NVIVSGGTGTGKTTTLNVLSSFIPTDERIVTIEDAKELQLHQEHVLPMEARPPNIEGKGQVTIRDLVRNALRMRPDRIVVGECRGGEALDMLQAMNTGHDGSITTIHSNSPRDTLARIETMVLMAGMDLPVRAIREQMASAIDLIVHLTRLRDGTRRVTHVSEVQGMEGDVVVLQDLFLFDFGMGVDDNGRFLGHLKSTGIRPKFGERLADNGIRLGPEIFAQEPFARRMAGAR
ncbi:MAG TPA: ATPase, T2SS/T4P/T4SS family, partial [Acidimicrobiia bacterium]|nr:ATPase, T2SS/T4P/T4SS family [Acidimicrobiia bacterium]